MRCRLLALPILVLLTASLAHAQCAGVTTCTAASLSSTDIQAALNSINVDNTTLTLPAGTSPTITIGVSYTYPAGITSVHVLGTGTSNTGIFCDTNPTSCGSGASSTTLIAGTTGIYNPILSFHLSVGQSLELGQLIIPPQTGATNLTTPIGVQGQCNQTTCAKINLHDLTAPTWDENTHCPSLAFCTWFIRTNNVIGVIKHTTIPTSAGQLILVNVNHANQFPGPINNPSGQYGDTSWASPTTFGTANQLYIEDNLANLLNVEGLTDCDIGDGNLFNVGGCRLAVRNNRVFCRGGFSCTGIGTNHGTDSTGRPRGGRTIEGYNNYLNCPTTAFCNQMFGFRSGVGLIHDNKLDAPGSGANALIQLQLFRTVSTYNPFGGCYGSPSSGQWDTNDGIVYFTGTAQAGSSTDHLVASGFTAGALTPVGAPFSVRNVSAGWGSEINNNGTTTIDSNAGVNGQTHPWTVGDTYQVLRATVCIDQQGRSGGNLLSGTSPTPVGSINETLDPTYELNDQIISGGFFHGLVSAGSARLIANRDYYAETLSGTNTIQTAQTSPTSPFNGSSGVGFGTLANRPTTCTPGLGAAGTTAAKGVAYEETDHGNQIDFCIALNTWSTPFTTPASYIPFTYPYPTGGGAGPTPPTAPTSLAATVSGSTVSLSWTASTGSPVPTAYTEYRGTIHNGPYAVVKSGLTSASTTDTPANGTYFYVVTAYVGGVVSSISANGASGLVTCTTSCAFPTGTVFTVGGNSVVALNGTFTSTSQPTPSTFTFSTSINANGTGGGVWQPAAESARSNEVSATVPSALTLFLAPASMTFASTVVGASSGTQMATVMNTSSTGSTVTFSSVSFTGTNPGDFSRTTTCTTLTVNGQTCNAVVTFTPTAAGARSALLTFVDNAVGSPQTIPVSGTGVAQTPGVSLNPTSLNFQSQTLSTTSVAQSIILTNTGSGTLTITSVVASGDFAVTTVPATNCGTTLASLATCSLNVTFTPTATGGRTGAITVTDNAAGSPHVANLQGVGITTKCALGGNIALTGAVVVCQ